MTIPQPAKWMSAIGWGERAEMGIGQGLTGQALHRRRAIHIMQQLASAEMALMTTPVRSAPRA